METVYPMSLWLVAFLAYACGGASVWLAPRLTRAIPTKQSKGSKTRALAAVFDERVRHLRQQLTALSNHSNEYSSIFVAKEWSQLVTRVEHYENVNLRIKRFIAAKSFDDAQAILDDLYDPSLNALGSMQSNLDAIKASTEWENSVRDMLKNVMRNLETAAQETRRTKIYSDSKQPYSPSRKRTSTLSTLAEVKKALLAGESEEGQS